METRLKIRCASVSEMLIVPVYGPDVPNGEEYVEEATIWFSIDGITKYAFIIAAKKATNAYRGKYLDRTNSRWSFILVIGVLRRFSLSNTYHLPIKVLKPPQG